MNKFNVLVAFALGSILASPTAFGYVQEVSNFTPETLEITFGYAAWGTRTGMRLKPGEMAAIDTGEMWDHKWVSDSLCLNEIRVRRVAASEGDKKSIVVKDASGKEFPPGLEAGDKDFSEVNITWVDDSTLAKIEEGLRRASGYIILGLGKLLELANITRMFKESGCRNRHFDVLTGPNKELIFVSIAK